MIQLPCFPDIAFGKRMGSTVRSRRTSGGHASRSQGQRAAGSSFQLPKPGRASVDSRVAVRASIPLQRGKRRTPDHISSRRLVQPLNRQQGREPNCPIKDFLPTVPVAHCVLAGDREMRQPSLVARTGCRPPRRERGPPPGTDAKKAVERKSSFSRGVRFLTSRPRKSTGFGRVGGGSLLRAA